MVRGAQEATSTRVNYFLPPCCLDLYEAHFLPYLTTDYRSSRLCIMDGADLSLKGILASDVEIRCGARIDGSRRRQHAPLSRDPVPDYWIQPEISKGKFEPPA